MRAYTRAAHRRVTGRYGCPDRRRCAHDLALVDPQRVPTSSQPETPKTPGSRRSIEGRRRIALERLTRKQQRGESLTDGQQSALDRLRREGLALGYVDVRELGARAKVTA